MMGYGKFRWEFETLLQFDGDGAGGSLSGKWEAGSVHQRAAAALWWMGWKDISDAARSGANALHAGRHRASKGVIRRRRTSQGATRCRCGRARCGSRHISGVSGPLPCAGQVAILRAMLRFCFANSEFDTVSSTSQWQLRPIYIRIFFHSSGFQRIEMFFFPFLLSFFEKRNFDLKKWIKFQFG